MPHKSAQPLRVVSSPIVTIPRLKELEAAGCSGCRGPNEQTSDRFLAHRLERLRSFERLVENFRAINTRYHGRGRQVERIMQALDGRHGLALKDEGIPHRFHSEHPDLVCDQGREDLMFETPKMRVQNVQRHLHGVKPEIVGRSARQHPDGNAVAPVIGPAVVHEGETTIDGALDNRYALRFLSLFADVIPAQADGRDFLSGPPQSPLGHSLSGLGHQSVWTCGAESHSRNSRFQERASVDHEVALFGEIKSASFINYRAHIRSSVARWMGEADRGVHCWWA